MLGQVGLRHGMAGTLGHGSARCDVNWCVEVRFVQAWQVRLGAVVSVGVSCVWVWQVRNG